MRAEYLGKTFKSGNSVAVRLPKGLGIKEGEQVRLKEIAPGNVRLEVVPVEKRKFNVDAIWGIAPWLQPLRPEDRLFEERALNWPSERSAADE